MSRSVHRWAYLRGLRIAATIGALLGLISALYTLTTYVPPDGLSSTEELARRFGYFWAGPISYGALFGLWAILTTSFRNLAQRLLSREKLSRTPTKWNYLEAFVFSAIAAFVLLSPLLLISYLHLGTLPPVLVGFYAMVSAGAALLFQLITAWVNAGHQPAP